VGWLWPARAPEHVPATSSIEGETLAKQTVTDAGVAGVQRRSRSVGPVALGLHINVLIEELFGFIA
jgi:hypothetical protein